MPSGMTMADIKADILSRLGGSGRMVELKENDVILAIKFSVREYSRWVPGWGKASINVSQSQKKYGPLQHVGLKGVLALDFVDQRLIRKNTIDPFDIFSYLPRTNMPTAGGTYGEFMQDMTYREMGRSIASAEPEWYAQWEGDKYYLYISVAVNYLCSYTYTFGYVAEDGPINGIGMIPDGDINWVIDYATTEAKMVLGRIRGKFMGIAGPDGELQIDAETLLSEARDERQRLDEDIRRRRRPIPPVIE